MLVPLEVARVIEEAITFRAPLSRAVPTPTAQHHATIGGQR